MSIFLLSVQVIFVSFQSLWVYYCFGTYCASSALVVYNPFPYERGGQVIKRIAFGGFVILLALTGANGRDDPKQEKKPPSAKEQFDSLSKEFSAEQQKLLAEYRKTKGEEQKKVLDKYLGLGKDYAEKFYKLSEDNPKDPVAKDALFWILTNAGGHAKAEAKIAELVAEMPLADLKQKVQFLRTSSAIVLEAVLKRAEKDEKDQLSGDLLGWIASNPVPQGNVSQIVEKASTLLLEKYPNHPAVERMCAGLGRTGSPKDAETLKKIIEKVSNNRVKAEASLALGQNISAQLDRLGDNQELIDKLAVESDKYLAQAVELFDKEKLTVKKESTEKELKAFRTFRVGKEAPDIIGKDLDEKEFKLSDYRGKVVLLDFWGNW